MTKAIIFDKDGVIVNTSKLHFEKWKKTFRKFKKEISYDFYVKNLSGRSAPDNLRVHFPNLTEEDIKKTNHEQLDFVYEIFDKYVTLIPGVREFLVKLKQEKFPMALATSSRKETTDHVLDRFEIRSYFSSITTADEVSLSKPDPAIYQLAAQKLRVEPEDCIVFEDSYFGVESAKKAGMKVILIMTNNTKKDIPNVDMAVKDFTQITVQDLKMI